MTIHYTFSNTPYETMIIAFQENKIIGLAFGEKKDALSILQQLFGKKTFEYLEQSFTLERVLSLKATDLILTGTPFQLKVWKELLKINRSETKTYLEIAQAIGHPKAVRAVGTAVGRNKISLLIPCHRVIPKNGGIGNYRWGSSIKAALLRAEKSLKSF